MNSLKIISWAPDLPTFPSLAPPLLSCLQFIYLRNKNQVPTIMPSPVLDTAEQLMKSSCCHHVKEANNEQNYFLNE